ncbi:MAG: hypothetical protein M3Y31_06695, partial [Gemmatimonadota bacterium]|nr:hypothetical protein [Gemmatimonadota bacterium]
MRALFVSHAYALPDARAKLRALAGLGYSIAAAVPEQAGSVAASDELGVQLIPVPVDGDRWDANALARAVAD